MGSYIDPEKARSHRIKKIADSLDYNISALDEAHARNMSENCDAMDDIEDKLTEIKNTYATASGKVREESITDHS